MDAGSRDHQREGDCPRNQGRDRQGSLWGAEMTPRPTSPRRQRPVPRSASTPSKSTSPRMSTSLPASPRSDLNSVDLETIKKAACAETDSRSQLHKLFYTSVPSAYRDDIQDLVVPKAGFEFDSDKEHYHVKVFDNCQPGSTLSCKCTVVKDNQELQLQKVELNQVRHLVADISCLPKDLDLRLMLCTKKILKNMDEEESGGINKLISSAIIDPDVKGGLRWPLGKESVAGRFSIVGVWHTNYKAFKSGTAKLYLRHADRFDHRTSVGEVSTEIMLKLTGISKHLREDNLEKGSLVELVEPTVELIWNHFLTNTHPIA